MTKMEMVVEELKRRGYEAKLTKVAGTNHAEDAIIIGSKNDISPVIYESYLNVGTVFDMVEEALRLNNLYSETAVEHVESFCVTKDDLIEKVRLAVCRADWNKEMLDDTRSKKIGETDLNYYIRYVVDGYGSFAVTDRVVEEYGLNWDVLYEAANSNDEYYIQNMSELFPEASIVKMLIVTNRSSCYGASAVCDNDILQKALERLGSEEMIIIPSSVHEILCVALDEAVNDMNYIRQMICDVNESAVERREQLSDHAYIYDGKVVRNA